MPNTLEKLLNLDHFKAAKILFIVSVLVVGGAILYFPTYSRLQKLRQANQELVVKINSLNKEVKDLQGKIKKLGKDPYIYEKIARDNLGVAKENEIVVDINE